MQYPGGKGASGIYQRLINQIPPHRIYIESHLGGGALMRYKKTAEINIGLDIDPVVTQAWRGSPHVNVICVDAVQYLKEYPFAGDEFIYADPPYLPATRRSNRPLYRNEYTEAQHIELLKLLVGLPCKIMISGYWSELYESHLRDWRYMFFTTRSRSGAQAIESVWMNYAEPKELHDYRYLGDSFRERERIRRRIDRWKEKLEGLPPLERNALIYALK